MTEIKDETFEKFKEENKKEIKEIGGIQKGRMFKCKICGRSFTVPKDNIIVNCPCGEHGYSEEIREG